ncbi:MAG: TlpA family protein disulfide reductase [Methylococcaceae bacterium]|nr:MAG: TlpA family protein disulfide reductase [Methylococcaceae bacterium]
MLRRTPGTADGGSYPPLPPGEGRGEGIQKSTIRKRLQYLLPILTAVLALTAGVAFQHRLTASRPASVITLPTQTLVDLEQRPHALTDWQGKVVMINFWASWCEPCREEIPALNRLQQQYADQGLQIIGIAIDDAEPISQFQAALPMDYPVLLAASQGIGLMERLGNRFGVLPYTVLFDRQGRMIQQHAGALTQQETEALLRPLLTAQ